MQTRRSRRSCTKNSITECNFKSKTRSRSKTSNSTPSAKTDSSSSRTSKTSVKSRLKSEEDEASECQISKEGQKQESCESPSKSVQELKSEAHRKKAPIDNVLKDQKTNEVREERNRRRQSKRKVEDVEQDEKDVNIKSRSQPESKFRRKDVEEENIENPPKYDIIPPLLDVIPIRENEPDHGHKSGKDNPSEEVAVELENEPKIVSDEPQVTNIDPSHHSLDTVESGTSASSPHGLSDNDEDDVDAAVVEDFIKSCNVELDSIEESSPSSSPHPHTSPSFEPVEADLILKEEEEERKEEEMEKEEEDELNYDEKYEMETYFLGDSTMTGYLSILQPPLQNIHQMDVRLQDVGEIIRRAQGYTSFVIFPFREELLQRCGKGRVTYPMAFDTQRAVEELLRQLEKGREANKNAHILICLADVVNIPAMNRSNRRRCNKKEQHRDLRALTRGAHFLARIWYTLNKHKHPYTTHINLRDLSPATLKHHPYKFPVMDHTRCTRFLTEYKINYNNDGSPQASSVLPALFAQRLASFFSSVPRPPTRVEVTLQDEDAISESDEWLNERELLQEPDDTCSRPTPSINSEDEDKTSSFAHQAASLKQL